MVQLRLLEYDQAGIIGQVSLLHQDAVEGRLLGQTSCCGSEESKNLDSGGTGLEGGAAGVGAAATRDACAGERGGCERFADG